MFSLSNYNINLIYKLGFLLKKYLVAMESDIISLGRNVLAIFANSRSLQKETAALEISWLILRDSTYGWTGN